VTLESRRGAAVRGKPKSWRPCPSHRLSAKRRNKRRGKAKTIARGLFGTSLFFTPCRSLLHRVGMSKKDGDKGPIASLLAKYPRSSGSLLQIYRDLTLAQKWSDVQALELPEADRAVLRGRRPEEAHANGPPIPIIVVPCTLSETLSITWLSTIFRSISTLAAPDDEAAGTGGDVTELLLPPPPQQRSGSPHRLQTEYLFLGITSPDGSQVYYKLSNGIVKPPL